MTSEPNDAASSTTSAPEQLVRVRRRRSSGERRESTNSSDRGDNAEPLLDNTALGLLAGVALLLLSEAPRLGGVLPVLCVIGGTVVLLLTLGMCRTFAEDLRPALLRGPNPLILLLGLWSVVCFFLSPFRDQAAADLMRVVAGIAAYGIAAYALPQGRQLGRAMAGLLLFGVVLSGYDLMQVAKAQGVRGHLDLNTYSAFGTHENVGSLLVLLIPPALAFAVSSQTDEKPRYAAQFAAFLLGFALLVARTRSAWGGALVALLVLLVLLAAFGRVADPRDPEGERQRRRAGKGKFLANLLGSPALMVIAGFAVLVAAGGIAPQLARRAGSLSSLLEDGSFAGRLQMWGGAARMVHERPMTGWGLGSFLVTEGRWTHTGKDVAEVLQLGAGHENIAHNYYVQWAADTGGVGLLLYTGALAAFLLAMVVAHIRGGVGGPAPTPLRRALALGAIAAVAGACVDAIASPAYNFHGVSTVLWAWMGLGIGALRAEPRRRPAKPGETAGRPALPEPTPWSVWGGSLLAGILLPAVVLVWGAAQVNRGKTVPRGTFQVSIDSDYVVTPGTSVVWKATFKDENGVEQPTMPGTTWSINGEPGVGEGKSVTLMRMDSSPQYAYGGGDTKAHAGLRIMVPNVFSPITVTGFYRERYNRPYKFAASVLVRPSATPTRPSTAANAKKAAAPRASASPEP